MMPMKRRFNQAERIALSWASGGRCAMCGDLLEGDWQGDHIIPYARGGHTDVLNGQAVCPRCNLKKGSSMIPWLDEFFERTWGVKPRSFQSDCFDILVDGNSNRRVINVTPAAGKTRLGVAYLKWLLDTGRIKRIVIVCPTMEVCDAWKREFARAGVQLATAAHFRKDVPLDRAFLGVCVTYASVCMTPDWFRLKFGGGTGIVFDEIHHLEDKSGWGESAVHAFDLAGNYTLGTTGTLWRPRSTESIPFVSYDTDGFIKTDFTYGYASALADGIVRSVSFPTWDVVETRYIRKGEVKDGSFSKDEDERVWADTLRCAIDPGFPFLRAIIEAAHRQLLSPLLRGGNDPAAGGIFFGESIQSLDLIQKQIFQPLGIRSMVVHSGPDCDDPKGDIKRFREDPAWEWILCAEMITEGVSINRLRVGVHGCMTLTELAFRQKLGRLLRVVGTDDKEAFYFMPRHPKLVELAETIESEKRQARETAAGKASGGGNGSGGENGGPVPMVALSASGEASDFIVGAQSIPGDLVADATCIVRKAGMERVVSGVYAAKLLATAGTMTGPANGSTATMEPPVPLDERKAALSKKISRLLKAAAKLDLGPGRYSPESLKEGIKRLHRELLVSLDGIYTNQRDACTLEQLEARYARIVAFIKERTGR
jgi:superfamily II DNA or RNA helicase